MKTVCKINQCVGCYACKDLCPKKAITIQDDIDTINAIIDLKKCIGCNICHNICQVNNPLEKKEPIAWFQGWTEDKDIRERSSSGGLAAELSRTIIAQGGIVCSCVFLNGDFTFQFVNSDEELSVFAGSKYVKSKPEQVYRTIKSLLNEQKTVMFIGLPCQCAALKKTTSNIKKGKLFLVDLICHGSPSSKLLDSFLHQYKTSLKEVKNISFRKKMKSNLQGKDESIVTPGTMDCYSIAFLNNLIHTENCYSCQYADTKRISDITIGDSWGSEIVSESSKGISLILCNTIQGENLLNQTDIHLENVNIDKAIEANPQLCSPAELPKNRTKFFYNYKKGKPFNKLVIRFCTIKWIKQAAKRILIWCKLVSPGDISYSLWITPRESSLKTDK